MKSDATDSEAENQPAQSLDLTRLSRAGALTVLASVAAVLAIRTWRKTAAGVLLISFAPDIALIMMHVPGAGWPEACALMSMHVAVWAICVTILPRLVTTKSS
jgi:hypothetical protein